MTDKDRFDAAGTARSLLRRSRNGALATLTPGTGEPYCSLVNVASAIDGTPILLISRLARHTRNVLADARASLLLHEPTAGDPLEAARIMISGRAEQVSGERAVEARRRYLAVHPAAQAFVAFEDFAFFSVEISSVHLVAGFGRIVDLSRADVLTDLAGAEQLVAAEEGAVAHMNEDHREALELYATRLLGAEPGEWRCTGCDPDGLDMTNGIRLLRLEFSRRIVTAADLRNVLKELASQARQR